MKRIGWLVLAVIVAVGAGCSPSKRDSAASEQTLSKVVVALKPDKNPEQMLKERVVLEAYLSERLGRPVEVITPLSGSVILEGFVNGTVDMGYLSASEMLSLREGEPAAILLAGEINGLTTYQSYWVSLRDKPYARVEDLRGKPIAFASSTSTSGCVVPHWDLIRKGLLPEGGDPQLYFGRGNVLYGTGYVSAIERVLEGDAEAAAVSYYVLDEDRHLTEEQRARLKKVAEQGPVPTHVIAVRTTIAPSDRELLKNALLALNEPEYQALRDKVFTSKLVEVNQEAHLAPLRDAMRLTGRMR